MSLSTVLAVAAGLFALFLVLSLAASALNEAIAGITKRRAATLENAVLGILSGAGGVDDPIRDLQKRIYDHPLIRPFQRKAGHRPSYIPASAFVPALLDEIGAWPDDATMHAEATEIPWDKIQRAIDNVQQPQLKEALTTLLKDAKMSGTQFRARVERWYDDTMERVSGWYTRHTQLWLWILGGSLVIVLNGDSVMVGRVLWEDPSLRDAVSAQTDEIAKSENLDEVTEKVGDLDRLQIPLGWDFDDSTGRRDTPYSAGGWILKVVGLIVTIAAISMGAAFWFDMLKRVANIRSSGPPPSEPTASTRP